MTDALGSHDSFLSHQRQYAGIAAYLHGSGLRDVGSLVDILGALNVRTAFWRLRYLPTGGSGERGDLVGPAPCTFPEPHVALVRLRQLLESDLHSLEGLLGVAKSAPHDRHRALTLHVQSLGRALRLITDLAEHADDAVERHDLEGRARHIRALLEHLDQPIQVGRHTFPTARRPRQPILNRRKQPRPGRPRMAG